MGLVPERLLHRLAGAPRWLTGLAIVAVFLVEPLLDENRHALSFPLAGKLEAIAYDARLLATMPATQDPQIVIVDIDEKSLRREGHWPWPRDKLARLVDQLFDRHGARLVGFDIVFPETDTSSGGAVLEDLAHTELRRAPGFAATIGKLRTELDFDERFAKAMRGRPVVLAFTYTKDVQRAGTLPAPAFTGAALGGRDIPVAEEHGYAANLEILQRAAASAGHLDPLFDSDNVVRRIPLVKRYEGGFYPALAVAIAQTVVEGKAIVPHFDSNNDLDSLDLSGLVVPVARDGTALIPYRGPPGSFRYRSATDILAGVVPADDFTGSIVLVGTTAKGLSDLRSTPLAPDYPGVEIHANLVAGMLNEELKSVPAGTPQIEALIIFVAGMLVVFAVPWRRPLLGVLGILVVAAMVIGVNLWFWRHGNAVVPLAATLTMLLVLLMWNLMTGYLREARAIRHLSDMFGEYVPPERVRQMREAGRSFSMEGESRELSVLFSDVRNFTSVSETLQPRELSAMMNAYLTPMTEVIHEHRGTIDKYIGDAIMAFWGAPLANPRHAHDAVAAALVMRRKMRSLVQPFRARGWPEIDIGIGINTGMMSIGDMGSRFRKAYTVLGDAVNLASRLEGLTKTYGIGVVCGDETRSAAPDFVWREVDRVRVKGRERPLSIWEPLGLPDDPAAAAVLAAWSDALASYRGRDFAGAREKFAAMAESTLRALYMARCEEFIAAPPPADWDGTTRFTTK
jgi:adenylate cyclase